MTRRYKRKRHVEADCRDSNGCNDLRRFMNKTERQFGKKECIEGLRETQEIDIDELRWNIENKMANDCYKKEKKGY